MDCVNKQTPRERWAGASLRCTQSGKGYRLGIVVGLLAIKLAKLEAGSFNKKPDR